LLGAKRLRLAPVTVLNCAAYFYSQCSYVMNKAHVIEHLRFALEAQLNTAKVAAKTAHDTATHEESIAETQYDTLGLEAAYLAQGHAQRVNECYKDIELFAAVFNEQAQPNSAAVGALICLADEHGEQKWFYLGPSAGGLTVDVKGTTIQVVTTGAPLGKQLVGKQIDDEICLTLGDIKQHYEIEKIL
jgi:transcription elongation GreA/GreB family factor